MGTARLAKEAQIACAQRHRTQEIERLRMALPERERAYDAQAKASHAAHAAQQDQIKRSIEHLEEQERVLTEGRVAQAQSRYADHSEV